MSTITAPRRTSTASTRRECGDGPAGAMRGVTCSGDAAGSIDMVGLLSTDRAGSVSGPYRGRRSLSKWPQSGHRISAPGGSVQPARTSSRRQAWSSSDSSSSPGSGTPRKWIENESGSALYRGNGTDVDGVIDHVGEAAL